MLEMKVACEKCEAPLGEEHEAVICSYECTFCVVCSTAMDHSCPNCRAPDMPVGVMEPLP